MNYPRQRTGRGVMETAATAVFQYKAVLKRVLDTRPSGTRFRLAKALGKNRSFVSQLANPAYAMPVPAQHLETIFELCHFSEADRAEFLAAYLRAHPRRLYTSSPVRRTRALSVIVPDLAESNGNAIVDQMIADLVERVRNLATPSTIRRRAVSTPRQKAGTQMKKLINDPTNVLNESLDGFALAHQAIVVLGEEKKFVLRKELKKGKVALISGGGSGHEPMHAGFVGLGMLDAACPGQIFTAPTPDQIKAAADAADTGGGCLFIVKNYEGDVMNFEMGAELAKEMSGRESLTIVTDDDVAVERSTYSLGRRGVAGTLVVEKIVGAAAEEGRALADLQSLGKRVNAQTRSMGVALTSCTVPAAGTPTFSIGDDEMEMGVGIHGEPGRRRVKVADADVIVSEMVNAILSDLAPKPGSPCLLFVNGFGATPMIELYLIVRAAHRTLASHGLSVARFLTGSYVTSLDMAGCSITVTVLDEGWLRLWDAPVHTAALRWNA